ncbi:hypothetical protein [Xanthomonas phaseoli]|uniref:hypothetical protein n=1 Tax=Xanthomonas phaseoli TaxID=1985254 RepID=UPI0012670861|nr:hypothetical protein [Xanthomonas phaseoli]
MCVAISELADGRRIIVNEAPTWIVGGQASVQWRDLRGHLPICEPSVRCVRAFGPAWRECRDTSQIAMAAGVQQVSSLRGRETADAVVSAAGACVAPCTLLSIR